MENKPEDIINKKYNTLRLLIAFQFISNVISIVCGTVLIIYDHLWIGIFLYMLTYFNTYNYEI